MEIINLQYGFSLGHPSIEKMLEYDHWELHEAAFNLTHWPENINTCSCEKVMRRKNISRLFFYLPGHPLEYPTPCDGYCFNPNDMGKEFLKIYSAMEASARSGELDARFENLHMGDVYGTGNIFYLVSPRNVIKWALLKGIELPEDFQKAIGVYLWKGCDRKLNKKEKSLQKKVKIKVKGQFLRKYFPGERTSFYCEHDWMKEYLPTDNLIKNKYRVIRNALDELRNPVFNRKQGNRSDDEIENDPYHPKAIEDVIYSDSSGIRRYNVPLLRVATETAANVLLDKYSEDSHQKMTLEQFLDDFMKNEVISLYTEKAPAIILELIRMFADYTVHDYFMWQACSQLPLSWSGKLNS